MKRLFLIGGTMGIGKTTISRYLKSELNNSVFLDGDWCWDSNPFHVTDETKEIVMNNICYMLNSFIHCSLYSNIIFCWVMHKQSIIDTIIDRIDSTMCEIIVISLTVSKEELTKRIMKDVDMGIRTIDVLDRSIAYIKLYDEINSIKVVTDGKTPKEIVKEISLI